MRGPTTEIFPVGHALFTSRRKPSVVAAEFIAHARQIIDEQGDNLFQDD